MAWQHKPLNWIQQQMGHRTLQMLLKHYWRWIPTDDLSAEEISSLESAAAPSSVLRLALCLKMFALGSPLVG
jgi:hypothetical protein